MPQWCPGSIDHRRVMQCITELVTPCSADVPIVVPPGRPYRIRGYGIPWNNRIKKSLIRAYMHMCAHARAFYTMIFYMIYSFSLIKNYHVVLFQRWNGTLLYKGFQVEQLWEQSRNRNKKAMMENDADRPERRSDFFLTIFLKMQVLGRFFCLYLRRTFPH